MLNNGNKTDCGFADEIVSYIYNEIDTADRREFETHLAQCSICTDEFTAISNARFSVFEWQREEFARLPTPEIVIPYVPKRAAVEEAANIGLLTAIRGWLTPVNLPVAVAAALVVCLGLGFLALRYFDNGNRDIASDVNVPPVESPKEPVVSSIESGTPEIGVEPLPPVNHTPREIRQVKAIEHRRPQSEKQFTARNQANRNMAGKVPDAPTLSENYEENDDASLRLADLFEDVGG